MKHTISRVTLVTILCAAAYAHADDLPKSFGHSFFAQRPQGQNQARYLSGEVALYPLCSDKCYSDVTSLAVEYTDNFNRDNIGKYMFFNGKNSMIFAGSGTNPENKDVDALNFFLADDFYSVVEANPRVQNIIVDLHTRKNLDEFWCGLYVEVDMPIVWTKWNMDLKETVTNRGTNIGASKLSNDLSTPAPVHSVIDAWKGTTLNRINLAPGMGNKAFPLVKEPLEYAKIDGAQTKTALADLRFLIGYNVLCCECYHFALNLRVVAPTGTRPSGEYMFEPVAGNGRHAELGGGIQAHYDIWSNDCDSWFSVWFDGYVNHFFKARQKRTFDWTNNGIGSRYLWLKKFSANPDAANFLEIVRGPNITTLDCNVQASVVGEATVLFDFGWCDWVFDFGYNAWGRSKEKVTITGCIQEGTYGIKGSASGASLNLQIDPDATINGTSGTLDAFSPANALKTSDLNPHSAAAPSALTHKVFGYIGHTWNECDNTPFIGLGGEAEFACSCKKNRALDQWGVWFKGGLTF